jgi:hypothetical protein
MPRPAPSAAQLRGRIVRHEEDALVGRVWAFGELVEPLTKKSARPEFPGDHAQRSRAVTGRSRELEVHDPDFPEVAGRVHLNFTSQLAKDRVVESVDEAIAEGDPQ